MQNVASPPKKGEDPKGGLDPLAAASALVHLPDASQPRHAPIYEGDRFRALALDPHVETVLCGDTVYNTRGYEVCGVQNQHGKPCRRIGKCPFHDTTKAAAAKDGGSSATPGTPAPGEAAKGAQSATPAAAPNASVGTPSPSPLGPPSAAKPAAASGGGLHADLAATISPTVAAPPRRLPFKTGWSKEEHIRFLNGLQIHGKGAWKEIAQIVVTRNATQVQSHAQKYFMRQKQEKRNKRSIHDLSVDDITEMSPATDLGARQVMAAVSAAAQAALKQAPAPPGAGSLVVPGRSGYLQEQMMMPQLMLQPPLSFPVVAQPSFVSQSSSFTGGSASFATSASGAFSAPAPAYPSAATSYYGQPHGAQPWYYPPHAYAQQQGSTRVDAHDDGHAAHAPHARHPTQELHTLATQGSLLIPQPLDRQATSGMSDTSMGTPTTPGTPLAPSLSGMLKDAPVPKRRQAEAQHQHEQSRQ